MGKLQPSTPFLLEMAVFSCICGHCSQAILIVLDTLIFGRKIVKTLKIVKTWENVKPVKLWNMENLSFPPSWMQQPQRWNTPGVMVTVIWLLLVIILLSLVSLGGNGILSHFLEISGPKVSTSTFSSGRLDQIALYCMVLRSIAKYCVAIHAKVLPGSVLSSEDWITMYKRSWFSLVTGMIICGPSSKSEKVGCESVLDHKNHYTFWRS